MALSYDELKDKVLQRYGDIDSIPDSVYNAMKSYKDNGASALDDDKTYNILVGERDYKPEPLPEVPQDVPSDYSFVGFAEPTTREKAEEYVRQNNPEAMNGYEQQSIADRELANERARQYGDAGGSALTLGHGAIQVPVGALMSGLEYAKDKLFNEGVEGKPFFDYFKESQSPESASNVLAHPSNFVGGGLRNPFAGAAFGGSTAAIDAVERNPNGEFKDYALPIVLGAGLGAGNVAVVSSPARFAEKKAIDLAANEGKMAALQAERNAIIKQGVESSPYTSSRQSMQVGDEIEAMTMGFNPEQAAYLSNLKAGGRLAEGLKHMEIYGSKLDRNRQLMDNLKSVGEEIGGRKFITLPSVSHNVKALPVIGTHLNTLVTKGIEPLASDILTSPISTKAILPAVQGVGFGLGRKISESINER